MNPLSQLYINGKFQKHVSVSIHQCQRASLLNSLLISYKNDEWCQFGVHICSPVLISFYCVCVASSASLFFSFTFCGVSYLLRFWGNLPILAIKQRSCSYNHFHNILRLSDVSPNFISITSETMSDYYL